jgi:hypothetical protein
MIPQILKDNYFKIIDSVYSSPDMRLYSIMVLLHAHVIGIYRAFELCEECEIFSRDYMEVSDDITKLLDNLRKSEESGIQFKRIQDL